MRNLEIKTIYRLVNSFFILCKISNISNLEVYKIKHRACSLHSKRNCNERKQVFFRLKSIINIDKNYTVATKWTLEIIKLAKWRIPKPFGRCHLANFIISLFMKAA